MINLNESQLRAIELYNSFQSEDRQRKSKAKYLIKTLYPVIEELLNMSGSMKRVRKFFLDNYNLDISLQTYYVWYRYYKKNLNEQPHSLKTNKSEEKTSVRSNILGLTQLKKGVEDE